MQKLYFMRHGQSKHNVMKMYSGTTDSPLTPEGRRQAKKAGQSAKRHGIDTIVCSTLSRAHDTAKIVAKEIGYSQDHIHQNSLLIERSFGDAEEAPIAWDTDLDGFTNIESHDEVLERAKLALKWIETLGGKNILVVSHGTLGRAMRKLLKPEIDYTIRLPNAKIERWL